MASRTLNVQITGDAKQFNRTLDSVNKQTAVTEGRVSKFSKTAKLAFAGAGLAAGGALVAGLSSSVKAAQEAEKSQASMEAQLKASGISYRAHAAEIDSVIQKTSRLAAVDDEDLQDAFTNIVRVTGDVNKSLNLTSLAADIARAKHIDVAKAGELVGKVAGGNVGILKRYGVQIKDGATAQEALAAAQKKFAGQAEAYGKTAAGAQDRFRNAVENLQEKIGAALLPVVTKVSEKVSTFVEQMTDGTGAGGRFARKMDDVFATLSKVLGVVKDVAGWLKDHPGLLAAAGAAWVTYKAAAVTQIGIVKAANLGLFGSGMQTKLSTKAGETGTTVGRNFAAKAGAAAAAGVAGWQIGQWLRKNVPAARRAGDAIGNELGQAIFGGSKLQRFADAYRAKLNDIFLSFRSTVNTAISKALGALRDASPKTGRGLGGPQGTGRISAFTSASRFHPSFSQNVAESDVAVAQTETTVRGKHILPDAYVTVLQHRSTLLGKRLTKVRARQAKIRVALRKKLTSKTRKRLAGELLELTQEEAALAAEINAIAGTIVDVKDEATPDTGTDEGTSDTGGTADTGTDAGTTEATATDTSAADLIAAIDANTQAMQQLAAETAKQTAHADAVSRVSSFAAVKALADVISGQIAGYGGYAGRAATAGAGSTFRL